MHPSCTRCRSTQSQLIGRPRLGGIQRTSPLLVCHPHKVELRIRSTSSKRSQLALVLLGRNKDLWRGCCSGTGDSARTRRYKVPPKSLPEGALYPHSFLLPPHYARLLAVAQRWPLSPISLFTPLPHAVALKLISSRCTWSLLENRMRSLGKRFLRLLTRT